MWTYRTPLKLENSPVDYTKKLSDSNHHLVSLGIKKQKRSKSFRWGGFLYLSGILIGCVAFALIPWFRSDVFVEATKTYLSQMIADTLLNRYASCFLSIWIPLTLCFMFGYSGLGFIFIPAIYFVRGFGVGVVYGFLYQTHGILSAVIFQIMLCIVPDIFCFFALAWLTSPAWNLSRAIQKMCHGISGARISYWSDLLLHRYKLMSLAVLLPCGVRIIGAIIYARFFA